MPDFSGDHIGAPEFEAAVRQVARQLYRNAHASGPVHLDGRERDEIIDTGTEIIVIEATQSRKLAKTKYDFEKSVILVSKLRSTDIYSDYNFRIILVTSSDPTADQSEYVKREKSRCPKEIISFSELFSRLFNARHYIRLRGDHFFGSVRDPANEEDFRVPENEYIPTALIDSGTGAALKTEELLSQIDRGGRYIFFGDYGSGKSMTLRDLYFRVRDGFCAGRHARCPVYLNLREHVAQTNPDEALFRHAERIGFDEPFRLIAAWRAGFVSLFLDGFDELIPPQFAASVTNLRQARRLTSAIVKKFIEQTPQDAAILIAGRESYFDGRQEAQDALGYRASAHVFDLAGFSDNDIDRFLRLKRASIPLWLPTRPLLLGYLANGGFLKDNGDIMGIAPAVGWDKMLERVCEREVRQLWGGLSDASELRRYIEGLASESRKSRDRWLDGNALSRVFRSVFGRDTVEPDDLLTARLPGLGAVPGRPGARQFIDEDFSDAAASGDVRRFIQGPYVESTPLKGVVMHLGELGRAMAVSGMLDIANMVSVALGRAGRAQNLDATVQDLLEILIEYDFDYSGPALNVEDANFDRITVDLGINWKNITFSRCLISTVELEQFGDLSAASNNPRFHDCVIDRVEGANGILDVPAGLLTGTTTVESFSKFTATNDAVLRSALPDSVKVLLTILRKLFMQRGSGRQYSALRRGLPANLVKRVDPVVAAVKSQGFAKDVYVDRKDIIVPIRALSQDALSIINGPNRSDHPLIASVRQM